MKIENMKISNTFLGRDNGILTFYLVLEAKNGGVTIGGYALDRFDTFRNKRVADCRSFELIDEILKVVGVDWWEELTGKYIRVQTNGVGSRVTKIGNIIQDEWLNFESFFEERRGQVDG